MTALDSGSIVLGSPMSTHADRFASVPYRPSARSASVTPSRVEGPRIVVQSLISHFATIPMTLAAVKQRLRECFWLPRRDSNPLGCD
jgi:hypothetical protein